MKFSTAALCKSLLFLAALFTFSCLSPEASAQEKPSADKKAAPAAKFPAAKRQAPEPSPAEADADFEKAADTDADGQEKEKDPAKATKVDKDGPNAIRKRDEWFYKQRSSADGHIPAGARQKALEHMQRRLEAEGRLVRRPDGSFAEAAPRSTAVTPFATPVTNTWSSIGPTPTAGGFFSPVTGRITTIAIDPTDATGNTLLIGGALGGIWRSTDAGASWTAEGDQDPSLAMGSIAFAPSIPATVYAGTGEQASIGFDIYYGAGVLKSTNGGLTWTQTCTTGNATCPFIGPYSNATPFGFFTLGGTRISYIAVNPTNPAMVLVGAQTQFAEGPTEGVYCSNDSGANWSLVTSASGEMSTFVGFASPTVAFAALGNPFGSTTGKNGIYKSTNANNCSLTFTQLSTGLPTESTMGRIDLGISPLFATDNTVYASIADGTNQSEPNLGVWVTTNGGTSWTQTTAPDICQAQCWYDNVVKVDPNGGAHAFFGGSAVSTNTGPLWVQRTANTGATWTSVIPAVTGVPGLPHVDNHAMAFIKLASGKIRMYLGNDGGIWRTDDAEAASVTWTNLNNTPLTLTQFYPALSIHPSSQAVAFAGAQDNGSQIYEGPPGLAWIDNGICGDGTGTAIDNVVPSTVYVACNGLNLAVSTQNGQPNTFLTAVNGINLNDNSSFVPPFVTDPSTANVVYAGSTKVYQSVDTGNFWTPLSGDLVNGAPPISDNLSALAVAPGNPKVIYAGANTGQIFVATNVTPGAGTFAAVTGQASLPLRQVAAIAVDGSDATGKTAYAAFSGFAFGTDVLGHLFKTTDGGTTWKDVSCTVANCLTPAASDLPNSPVNDVVIDPDIAGTLYAATDIGVYQGTCTATTCTWSPLSTGLPRSAVLSLKLHHASRTLRAATHGRGAWDIVLNNFTFPGPHISSLGPVSVPAGILAPFVLTVNGNGLTGGTVKWNGLTTGVTQGGGSDTQLTATIATSLTGGGGTPQITVTTGAGTSNALTFTVLGTAPTIASVSPTSKPVNSAATLITVMGTGFASNAKVLMNPDNGGTAIPTTFVSATQLTATIPAGFMANFGSTNSVGVQNPPPGGGTTLTTQTVTLPTFIVVAPAPTNDNFANAVNITSTTFSDTKDSSGATPQSSDPAPASISGCVPSGSGLSNTIWYKVVPSASGTANIDTIGSSYDSVLSVWSGTLQSALTGVACNDDINPGIVTVSQLTGLALNAGTTYYIMVSSFGPLDPNPVAFGGMSVLNFTFTGTIGSNPAPTITSISPNNTTAGGSSFVLNVTGTNFVSGATVNFGANPALTPSAITPTLITVTVPASDIATAGTPGVTVTTSGGTSNSVTFTVNAATTGTFTVAGTAVTVTAGTSQTSTITVTPSGGFTGTVNVTCPAAGLPPQGETPPTTTCSPNPLAIVVTAGAKTGQLTVSVPAPSTNLTASAAPDERTLYAAGIAPSSRGRGWWMLSAGAGLTAMLLLILPGRKRYRAALGLGLVCVLSFTLGCGGSGGGTSGPVVTQTKISVNSAKLASNDPTGFKFTVTVTASVGANGQVQLFDGSNMLGSATSVSNGTTTITSAGLAPGTHSISAHYLGDSATQASQSGMLNVTSTGTTTFVVSTQPAASNGTPTVSITIN
jgi:hypothetical protein